MDKAQQPWPDRLPESLTDEPWPEPEPLVVSLKPVEPFNEALLPDSLRSWVADIANRMQCPADFLAVAAMVALATVIGRKIGIHPKRYDDWLVVVNLYGMVIGNPALLKTPALNEALKMLVRLEIEAKKLFDESLKEADLMEMLFSAKKKAVESRVNALMKKGDEDGARLELEGIRDDDQEQPTRKRYIVNNTTIEKLGEILNQNPQGVLLWRDEFSGFLKTMEREDRSEDRGFYLEAWNGNGRYTYDRIGRGTLDIEAAIVSMIGTIQPGVLRSYIAASIAGGAGDDGLMQRFQLAVYPDISKKWRYVDRWPDKDAKKRAFDVFKTLSKIKMPDGDDIPSLRFDDAAQKIFIEWLTDLENTLRAGELHPALESHLTKYRSLIPSLALIIQLADNSKSQTVGKAALLKACAWGDYLRSHAERIYSSATDNETVNAQTILDKIECGKLKDGFGTRQVRMAGWAGLTDIEQVKKALAVLCEHGYLREQELKTGQRGRPSVSYRVNPKFLARTAK